MQYNRKAAQMTKLLQRTCNIVCVLLMMNVILLDRMLLPSGITSFPNLILRLSFLSGAVLLYLFTEILPCYEKGLNLRLQILSGGYELIVTSFWCLILEISGYLIWYLNQDSSITHTFSFSLALINAAVAYVVLLLHYLNGFWRTAFCSSQLGAALRILMFLFWWLPPVNVVLFLKWCAIIHRELLYEKNQYLLDSTRVENAICQTRYPVVMVHGIFFRDWQYLNYWGRIPRELKRNGAAVYYGKQQSSRSIADSAAELKEEICRILAETGAEKVNIVAHSKGGLDSRYAISRLGMAEYVASLTTINTPHRGCKFADVLLKAFPDCFVHFVAARYNAVFHKLGDAAPDFLSGVQDLTAASCAIFNEAVPDSPLVYYQSSMSKMHSMTSAVFPLNIAYLLVKKYEGDNDGLVSVTSAPWGHYLGLLTAGRKGISHGDMIDLTHKNIKGFDVSEFYVQLLAALKEKGF